MIKIQLYNSRVGTLTVKPDAIGSADFEQTIKRSEQYDGVTFEYALDLRFLSEAKEFLLECFEKDQGIEAVTICNVFEYDANSFSWPQIASGTIKFTNAGETLETYKTSIEQVGVQRKILNQLEVDVDLDTLISQGGIPLPATPLLTLTMHPKTIVKETKAFPTADVFQKEDVFHLTIPNEFPTGGTVFRDFLVYGQIDNGRKELEEFPSFDTPYGYDVGNDDGTGFPFDGSGLGIGDVVATTADYQAFLASHKNPRFEVSRIDKLQDTGIGSIRVRWRLKHKASVFNSGGDVDVRCGGILTPGSMNKVQLTAWFEHRDQADNIIGTIEKMGEWAMPGCGDDERESAILTQEFIKNNITISLGDKIYIYYIYRIYGRYDQPSGLVDGQLDYTFHVESDLSVGFGTFYDIKVNTSFPATPAKSYLIYEALQKMVQFYSDQVDCIRSDYFGRTDAFLPAGVTPYLVDGKGGLRAFTSGARIRQTDNKVFSNMKDMFQSLQSIDCIGMGFEVSPDTGRNILRFEPLDYFYKKDQIVIHVGVVADFEEIVNTKPYFNQIEIGYPKLDIKATNGIDEPNTLRRFKPPITEVPTKLTAVGKYKTAAYEIEEQRRLVNSTADSKNDDANFFIDLTREAGTFRPTRDDGFTLIQNLFDAATSYNINLIPGRNLTNWLKQAAIVVLKSFNKVLTFSYGDGNYRVVTQKTGEGLPIVENGDRDISNIIADAEAKIYKFKVPLKAYQMKIIREMPYGVIQFQKVRGGVTLEGYINKVSRSSSKNLGTFELIKVNR